MLVAGVLPLGDLEAALEQLARLSRPSLHRRQQGALPEDVRQIVLVAAGDPHALPGRPASAPKQRLAP
jgi:hypothetical protein